MTNKSDSWLFRENHVYKPMRYPFAYEAWLKQQRMHWLPEEVPLADDVVDWRMNLTAPEKNLLTQIFRFFVQADVEVSSCYQRHYSQVFKPIEVLMMLTAFSSSETVHIAAYSHLLDTVGIPEVEYSAFLQYKEMKDKYDYMQGFNADNHHNLAMTMAVFGGFTEGMQLFASFAMLLNFTRFGQMKGMGQMIAWSVRDESLHCDNVIRLYHTFLEEHPRVNTPALRAEIAEACRKIVGHEDAFVDLAFAMGPVKGLTAEQMKRYIRYTANRRLRQLRLEPIYDVPEDPLPWFDELITAVEHSNFFENRSTEYSKASTRGSWEDVWARFDVREAEACA
jgi:ribonucleoside-diphosphate reductase beta chain